MAVPPPVPTDTAAPRRASEDGGGHCCLLPPGTAPAGTGDDATLGDTRLRHELAGQTTQKGSAGTGVTPVTPQRWARSGRQGSPPPPPHPQVRGLHMGGCGGSQKPGKPVLAGWRAPVPCRDPLGWGGVGGEGASGSPAGCRRAGGWSDSSPEGPRQTPGRKRRTWVSSRLAKDSSDIQRAFGSSESGRRSPGATQTCLGANPASPKPDP